MLLDFETGTTDPQAGFAVTTTESLRIERFRIQPSGERHAVTSAALVDLVDLADTRFSFED